jgi:RHS repeat-associated protein
MVVSLTYLQHDQLGSVRLLTDPTGNTTATYSYDPYGRSLTHTGTGSTPLLYNGQYQDTESNFYYLRARYYDPSTAQFLTRDPLEAETGAAYSYAGDDPLDFGDPTGLDWGWNPIDDIKQAGSDLGSAADTVGDAIGDGFVWADQHLNPMYYAVEGYAKEIDAYENGCGYWDSVKYGVEGTGKAAAATAAELGPGKVVEWLGPGARLTGRASWLFGRARYGQQGILNRGVVRIGWGWKVSDGKDVFRIGVGGPGRSVHGHFDF